MYMDRNIQVKIKQIDKKERSNIYGQKYVEIKQIDKKERSNIYGSRNIQIEIKRWIRRKDQTYMDRNIQKKKNKVDRYEGKLEYMDRKHCTCRN